MLIEKGCSSVGLARFSEVDLVKRAQRHDRGAFEELVGRTEDKLYRLAMHYVHNDCDAHEILQNSYLSAWRSLPTFEGRSGFTCWIYRITVNAALMFLRTRNRYQEIGVNDVEAMESSDVSGQVRPKTRARTDWSHRPDEEFQSAELRGRIKLAVDSLPQDLKAIFLLRAVRELSTEASAGVLGVSIPAAKTRLHRARKVLRESLGSYLAC